jgi:hypothetical protein
MYEREGGERTTVRCKPLSVSQVLDSKRVFVFVCARVCGGLSAKWNVIGALVARAQHYELVGREHNIYIVDLFIHQYSFRGGGNRYWHECERPLTARGHFRTAAPESIFRDNAHAPWKSNRCICKVTKAFHYTQHLHKCGSRTRFVHSNMCYFHFHLRRFRFPRNPHSTIAAPIHR